MSMKNEEEILLTPKGMFYLIILDALNQRIENSNHVEDYANEQWYRFEAFCIKRLHEDDPDARFAALIFDGVGGEVIGVTNAEDV